MTPSLVSGTSAPLRPRRRHALVLGGLLLAAAAVLGLYADLVRSAADQALLNRTAVATLRPAVLTTAVRSPDDLRLLPISVQTGHRTARDRRRGAAAL